MTITKRDSKGRIAEGSNKRHGLSKSPFYDCWIAMKARCNNPQHPMYKHYGARGITVCKEWQSFDNFQADMYQDYRRGLTLDRIDNNAGYSKGNCRWITIQEQQKNKSDNNTFVGVVYEQDRDKWRAEITYKRQKHFLGRFKYFDDALVARQKAEQLYWNV